MTDLEGIFNTPLHSIIDVLHYFHYLLFVNNHELQTRSFWGSGGANKTNLLSSFSDF